MSACGIRVRSWPKVLSFSIAEGMTDLSLLPPPVIKSALAAVAAGTVDENHRQGQVVGFAKAAVRVASVVPLFGHAIGLQRQLRQASPQHCSSCEEIETVLVARVAPPVHRCLEPTLGSPQGECCSYCCFNNDQKLLVMSDYVIVF
jgi:hypothetical protein